MSLTTSEMTPADIRACTCGNDGYGDGMFGNGAWWIIILLLFGWGRNGNFGGGFGGGCSSPCATQADVRAAVDQQTLISKLDQQTYGLADSTYALNNAISNGFHGVDTALCNLGYNVQSGLNGLSHQISDCCCTTQRAIDGINNTINNTTRDVLENQNSNTRAILDFLTQDKISTLTAENQNLKLAASLSDQNSFITANQEAQTAELLRRLSPTPTPAYVVPNPNCCYQYSVTPSCGGCGCGFNGSF